MSVARMLKGHEVFQSLTVEEVDRVSKFSSTKSFQAGEFIFRHEGVASHVFLLLEGRVRLLLPAEGGIEIVVGRAEPGDLFGLSPFLGSTRYTASGLCVEPTTVLAIEAAPFNALLKANAHVGMAVMGAVARAYFSRYVEMMRRLQGVVGQMQVVT